MDTDENTSAVHQIDAEVRRDIAAAREVALREENMAGTEKNNDSKRRGWLTIGTIAFTWTVLVFLGGKVWDAGGLAASIHEQNSKLEQIRVDLAEIRASQRENELSLNTLTGDLKRVSERAEELSTRVRELEKSVNFLQRYVDRLKLYHKTDELKHNE